MSFINRFYSRMFLQPKIDMAIRKAKESMAIYLAEKYKPLYDDLTG